MQAAPKLCRALRFWGLHPVPIGFEQYKVRNYQNTLKEIHRKTKEKATFTRYFCGKNCLTCEVFANLCKPVLTFRE
jgi:hypothetical protein